VKTFAVYLALALAGSGVCAQNQLPATIAAQKQEFTSQQNLRIVALLEQLADQARLSSNLGFAVRAQSQAAKLLWPQERDRARAIYQRAFQSLAPGAAPKPRDTSDTTEVSKAPVSPSSPAEKRQLRTELLNQVAARDPEFAEELARGLANSSENPKADCGDNRFDCTSGGSTASPLQPAPVATRSREDAERCELLMSAAFQIVDRDPQQAMAFAQMSLALGVSPNFARLLTMLRNVDQERADLLFSNALERLQQTERPALPDVPSQLDPRARGVHVLPPRAPGPRRAGLELGSRDRQPRRHFDSPRRPRGGWHLRRRTAARVLDHDELPSLGARAPRTAAGRTGARITRTAATRRPSIATTSSSPPGKGTRSPIFGSRPRRAKVYPPNVVHSPSGTGTR